MGEPVKCFTGLLDLPPDGCCDCCHLQLFSDTLISNSCHPYMANFSPLFPSQTSAIITFPLLNADLTSIQHVIWIWLGKSKWEETLQFYLGFTKALFHAALETYPYGIAAFLYWRHPHLMAACLAIKLCLRCSSSQVVLLASSVSSASLYSLLLDVRSFLQFQVQINYKEGTTEISLAGKHQSFVSSEVLGAQSGSCVLQRSG